MKPVVKPSTNFKSTIYIILIKEFYKLWLKMWFKTMFQLMISNGQWGKMAPKRPLYFNFFCQIKLFQKSTSESITNLDPPMCKFGTKTQRFSFDTWKQHQHCFLWKQEQWNTNNHIRRNNFLKTTKSSCRP